MSAQALEHPDGYAFTCEAWERAWRPRRPLSAEEWAARYRRLSSKTSAEPGPWNPERNPLLNEPMAFLSTHSAPLFVIMKAAQVGGSEIALNLIGCMIHQEGESILILLPTAADARRYVRTRLDVMLSETPELRALIPSGRRSDSGNTLQEKHGPGFVLFVGSAGIPTDISGISVPNIVFDELDRMPLALEDEGDPVELAKRRATTFMRRKVLEISTPTTDVVSRIYADWVLSSQRRYHVPCPHCGRMQVLVWENVKYPEGRPREAQYMCGECAALIPEQHKTDMLAAGEWRATYPEREHECVGWHLSGLTSPVGLGFTWGQHAVMYERARGNPDKLQAFYNTNLGEVFKSERQALEWETLYQRREPYKLRTIPKGVLLLTAGADIQHDRIEVQMLGWAREERTTVIDYQVLYGDPTRSEVWDALDKYLAAELLNEYGVRMRISGAAIDSGNWQHEVTNFTRMRNTRNIFACKGSSIASRQPIGKPSLVDVNYRGQSYKHGAEQYQIGVSVLKTLLYRRLKADAEVLPADRHVRFSEELNEEYFRQLAAETWDAKAGWRKLADRNEALDTFILARAAAMHHKVQIHRMRELDWQRLESMYEPNAAPDGAQIPQQVIGRDPIPTRGGGFIPTTAAVRNEPMRKLWEDDE